MITIDGSFGEGGGQILRTSLALSLVTAQPFRITQIRAGRRKPGLMRQHLAAVDAAVHVGNAEVSGNAPGSCELMFRPKTVRPGTYHFTISTAGSCTLVLQTVLPALLIAPSRSDLVLEGGTHNPMAPPFDFLEESFLPILNRMGPRVSAQLDRPGFYPAGGGRFSVSIEPCQTLSRFDLLERGEITRQYARAIVAHIPVAVADRELKVVQAELGWDPAWCDAQEVGNSRGPGNVLTLVIESKRVTEVFTGFGERGVPAEVVAARTVVEARRYLDSAAPVGPPPGRPTPHPHGHGGRRHIPHPRPYCPHHHQRARDPGIPRCSGENGPEERRLGNQCPLTIHGVTSCSSGCASRPQCRFPGAPRIPPTSRPANVAYRLR